MGRRSAQTAMPATPLPLAPALAPAASPTPVYGKLKRSRRGGAAAATAALAQAEPAVVVEPAVPRAAFDPESAPAAAEDVLPPAEEVEARAPRRTRRRAAAAAGGASGAAAAAAEAAESAAPEKKRRGGGRQRQRAPAAAAAGDAAEAEAEEGEEEPAPKKKRGGGRRREPDPLPLADLPTPELVARLTAEGYTAPPLPVPNLGYACLNMALREHKPPVFTSRDCRKDTVDKKGMQHLGELALANCRDLAAIIQWNHEHRIRLFRMSSVLLPWMGTFEIADLPQYEEISAALRFAGDLARLYGQRITFHPSHFVKLAAPNAELAAKSRRELEAHSQIMDLMGYQPSCQNAINIHVGGTYATHGSKEETMRRWADNYALLSPACRARLTVENDDVATAFSVQDLLQLHAMCGVPIVFDFHHWKFCPGDQTEREALMAAVATWPPGVRPKVHWSESQAGRKPHAHSDYVRGPVALHGLEGQVDVMIEAKCKERALLAYRGDIPLPPEPAPEGEGEGVEDAED
ncbi:UV damage endonuclease [Micractinium conductrix]|uniref:UV damage endonuclease n=1 Tax=Micractinium conductrix TaxID=554055 RepID=A0A2P6V0K5_9CHLO|nr:UV damage endonuclease [Micractinium conductrix]|eukprot:PSC67605.1 UV damage endonuclease [Micractinium conductrix]